jgi:hypothetical protein
MPTAVQFRRGTTAEHSTFTGAIGELTVDTDKNTVVVHDGSTVGGTALVVPGASVTLGNLTVSGTLSVEGTTITVDSASAQTVDLGDDDQIRLGDANDFTLEWDGTNALVNALGTTKIQSSGSDQMTVGAAGVSILNTMNIAETIEQVDIDTSTSATLNFDFKTSAVKLLSNAQTANRTINFRASSGASLDSIMSVGESMTCAVLATQGATPYYLSSYQIDGSGVSVQWSGGSAPTGGNASSTDIYSFTIIKTGAATFTVLGSQTQYA